MAGVEGLSEASNINVLDNETAGKITEILLNNPGPVSHPKLRATCLLHIDMMQMNGGECPAPLLEQVQADFHRLEELSQSVSEGNRT